MNHQYRLKVEDTALLVVDMQEKLLPKIMQADEVIRNASFLVNAAKVLGVPVLGTEQYPKGLGPTVEPIRGMLTKVWEKQTFSAVGEGGALEYLKSDARIKLVVVGIEAHICVMQTVLDLLNQGFHVFVCVDAVSSRYAIDVKIALKRMQQAGAIMVTAESCVYEWLETAANPAFKEISAMVQERMRQIGTQGNASSNK
ncbi:MAG: hydrolase [Planctomycetaceae bacterium]|nr:hydrolase [Gemmataceae bacterium]PHX63578.1 MAG: hydrolase [Planctomycetaceae bacterium]